jgi:hypothetical protein
MAKGHPKRRVPPLGIRGHLDHMSFNASAALFTVAARTVGGQAPRPETTPANKE